MAVPKLPSGAQTLSPYRISAEDALRLSVKKGVEEHFFKAAKNFSGADLVEVINKKYSYDDEDELTLLIETTLFGHIDIIKHLLKTYHADVNAVGKVKHFGTVVDGASPLWAAAGYGHFEIVKLLIENGANIDHCTKTKSTPLRAACYLGRADIVEYLIEHGANVNITNVFNSTCLMIASYKGHVDVVKHLLMNKADVNQQTNCGASAMHFAAQADHIKIIKLLLDHNAFQLKNKQGLTPILVAADRTHFGLVYFLIDTLDLTREEQIEAEELLGASFLNDKEAYNVQLGYNILLRSMEMRYNQHPIIPKKIYKQVEAYDNRVECQTVRELENIRVNYEALHYESLIIREKILGENNPDLMQSIIYRGAVYADSQNYKPCLKLWHHAIQIAQNNQISIFKDLLRFTQVFCQMIKAHIKVELSDLITIFNVAIGELKANQKRLSEANSLNEKGKIETEYSGNILSTLGLIMVTSITLDMIGTNRDPLVGGVMNTLVEINKLDLRTRKGQTLLHLMLNYDTNVDKIFTLGICCFPNYPAMKLLIFCGADVNAVDFRKNTPLHYIGKFIRDFPHIPHKSNYFDTKKMVLELLNAGAHTDYVSMSGACPYTQYLNVLFPSTIKTPRNLKCIAASAVRNYFRPDYYQDQLPQILEEFTNKH